MTKKCRVFLVDDHPIVRAGLAQLISQESDMDICGQASEAAESLNSIDQLKPDVAIVDVSLKGTNGIELTKQIRIKYPEVKVLILSMHDESIYAERALRAGAKGYVMKQEGTEKLIESIRRVVKGDISVSEKISTDMLERLADPASKKKANPISQLTDRELEVFRLLGEGKGTRQIADKLSLSIKTIETYREHIKDKLGLTNATELIERAVRWVHIQDIKA